MNASDRPRRELRPPVRAGDPQAVRDVPLGLEPVERGEVITNRDPLAKLAQALLVELVAQLGLADQDDLEELALVRLEVREQAHLLEEIRLEVLRLVDQEHHVVPGRGLLQEITVQHLDVGGPVDPPRLETELDQDRPHQLRGGHHRVQDQRRVIRRPELRQDRAAHGRLPGADLSRDLDEPLAFADPEEHVVERLAVLVREEEEAGVGGDVEGGLAKPVELVVHRSAALA